MRPWPITILAQARCKVLHAEASGRLGADALAGTDLLELSVFAHARHRHALLVARLDNLGKGASGQAVQNICLMLGLPYG